MSKECGGRISDDVALLFFFFQIAAIIGMLILADAVFVAQALRPALATARELSLSTSIVATSCFALRCVPMSPVCLLWEGDEMRVTVVKAAAGGLKAALLFELGVHTAAMVSLASNTA